MKFKSKPSLKIIALCFLVLFPGVLANSKHLNRNLADALVTNSAANPPATNTSAVVNPEGYIPKKCTNEVPKILDIGELKKVDESMHFAFPVCPHVRNACCDPADAEKFVKHWEKVHTTRIKKGLDGLKAAYFGFFDKLTAVADRASVVYSRLLSGPNSECKNLARSILTYRIGSVTSVLKTYLDQCHQTLTKAYKGLYCAVCDADYHALINAAGGDFGLSLQDCRELSVSCFNHLLYMHEHLPGLLALVLDFSTMCTAEGKFEKFTVDPDMYITKEEGTVKKLLDARDNRNGEDWANFFTPICTEFRMGEVNQFLIPHIEKYNNAVKYIEKGLAGTLKAEIAAKKAAEKKGTADPNAPAKPAEGAAPAKPADGAAPADKTTPPPPPTPPARILQGATETPKDPAAAPAVPAPAPGDIIPLKPFFIFNFGIATPIDAMKTSVKELGVDPYLTGLKTMLSPEEFAAAKQMAAAPKVADAKDAKDTAAPKRRKLMKTKHSRRSSGSSRSRKSHSRSRKVKL